MKNFKKALGIGIIAMLFMSIFVWMAQDSSIEIALKTYGSALGIVIVVVVGVGLVISSN